MEILNTTTTRTAKATTESGNFHLEYIISDNALTRVTASVFTPEVDNMQTYLGTISFENEIINSSLPVSVKSSIFFDDFEKILGKIQLDVQSFNTKRGKS